MRLFAYSFFFYLSPVLLLPQFLFVRQFLAPLFPSFLSTLISMSPFLFVNFFSCSYYLLSFSPPSLSLFHTLFEFICLHPDLVLPLSIKPKLYSPSVSVIFIPNALFCPFLLFTPSPYVFFISSAFSLFLYSLSINFFLVSYLLALIYYHLLLSLVFCHLSIAFCVLAFSLFFYLFFYFLFDLFPLPQLKCKSHFFFIINLLAFSSYHLLIASIIPIFIRIAPCAFSYLCYVICTSYRIPSL